MGTEGLDEYLDNLEEEMFKHLEEEKSKKELITFWEKLQQEKTSHKFAGYADELQDILEDMRILK